LRYQSCQTAAGTGAPAAVLIHELGGSLESWDSVAPALAAALPGPMRWIRYDQRGQGRSARVRAGYTLADQADDLHALLAALGVSQPVWLIAAAAGAAIAVRYAALHPQRVAGLVLCAPALDIDAARRRYLLERGDMAVRDGMQAVVEGTMDNSWPPRIRTDMRAFDAYRSRFLAQDSQGYAWASAALSEIDLREDLGALRCPCLFLAGEHDLQRPPARVAEQAALAAHARFEVVPEAGHLMAVQQPAQVAAQIVAFMQGGR
jgi:3-oxoadipate enol-lactonase